MVAFCKGENRLFLIPHTQTRAHTQTHVHARTRRHNHFTCSCIPPFSIQFISFTFSFTFTSLSNILTNNLIFSRANPSFYDDWCVFLIYQSFLLVSLFHTSTYVYSISSLNDRVQYWYRCLYANAFLDIRTHLTHSDAYG